VQTEVLHPSLIVEPSNYIETKSGTYRAVNAEQPECRRRPAQKFVLLRRRVLQYLGEVPVERSDCHCSDGEPAQNQRVAAREKRRLVRDGVLNLSTRARRE
jgi:hypothetical protein